MSNSPSHGVYTAALTEIDRQLQALAASDARFGNLRVGLFFLLVVGVGFAIATGHSFWIVLAVVAMFVFLVVVIRNETVRTEMEVRQNQSRTLRRLLRRLDRDWDSLAGDSIGKTSASIPLDERQKSLADDLDLMGHASLFQLVSMTASTPGQRTLANWLTRPVDPGVAMDRHHAVKALVPATKQRLRFYTLARDVGTSTGDPDSFVQWAGSPMWLPSRRWLLPWANVTALLAIVCLVALVWATLAANPDVTRLSFFALVAIATINLLLASLFLGPVAEIFSIAIQSRRSVHDYAELFQAAELLPTDAPEHRSENQIVKRIRDTLLGSGSGQGAAGVAMKQLVSVAKAASLKQSAATFLIYLPLQAFGLWDVRVLRRLEDWKARYRSDVEGWFVALGELESLFSLAALAEEHPDWSSPEWIVEDQGSTDDEQRQSVDQQPGGLVQCTQLGHPLLSDEHRVRNDVTIGPAGTLLLVTGSNMSGKSTMLRSVGLNVALAMAGGPVCCQRMRLPALEMATSIRVSDDLSQGVSFYMAELNRLAAVVQHARELKRDAGIELTTAKMPQRRLLFLLDEILQGTNSRERQIAVTRVLGMLVQSGAIGAITTHDLELADEPDLMRMAQTVHFRETITPDADGDERMTFDYIMREGVSPTTNALRLLEMVGLGEQ